MTSFVSDVANVKKTPVSLLLFNMSEFKEDKNESGGRLPPTAPPTTVRALKVDSCPIDAGSVPPILLTPVTEMLTTADAEHVTYDQP